MKTLLYLFAALLVCSCSSGSDDTEGPAPDENLYFPPLTGSTWETVSPAELGWNTAALNNLDTFLTDTNTEAFIILENGKIAFEAYYDGKTAADFFAWNSAGKTLTAFTVGLAEQKGLLELDDKTTDYLGRGWTSMTPAQEDAITIKNQLTMTSGGDFTRGDIHCYDPECLYYRKAPGTEWYYYNAYYTLLQPVLDAAAPNGFDAFFKADLKDRIGMDGRWVSLGYNNVYFSTARGMARFGLLNLNKGSWGENKLLNTDYWDAMINTSQPLNPAYGYLWWLNGKSSFKLPSLTESFTGKLIPNAPDDLIAGLGANDKKLYVIPSQNRVIVRLGPAADADDLGPTSFDNELWGVLKEVFK
ncbi:serine hydrolase domain-containing protein [Leeuwenhoekiella sp. H156]|uniref:serine hydrolase domain-containing protein n=1 Tax=Leeuwenhoekiella sp. H156 TaxID=3450128 RepID=UPI003FA4C2B0